MNYTGPGRSFWHLGSLRPRAPEGDWHGVDLPKALCLLICRPNFQIGILVSLQQQGDRALPGRACDVADFLLVSAVECIRDSQQWREIQNEALRFSIQGLKLRVCGLWHCLPVKAAER